MIGKRHHLKRKWHCPKARTVQHNKVLLANTIPSDQSIDVTRTPAAKQLLVLSNPCAYIMARVFPPDPNQAKAGDGHTAVSSIEEREIFYAHPFRAGCR
jgi:hypothetical protein